jgi:hypothetical protein
MLARRLCTRYAAVYGGSEEIMVDLGVRQAMKDFPSGVHMRL